MSLLLMLIKECIRINFQSRIFKKLVYYGGNHFPIKFLVSKTQMIALLIDVNCKNNGSGMLTSITDNPHQRVQGDDL